MQTVIFVHRKGLTANYGKPLIFLVGVGGIEPPTN